MKPVSKRDSWLQHHFIHPHDVWYNQSEGIRIAKRRWKRKRSKLLRKEVIDADNNL